MGSIHRLHILYIILIIVYVHSIQSKREEDEIKRRCERGVHSSFNQKQRAELCASTHRLGNGPAHCASLARDKHHLSTDEAVTLCSNASSVAPVLCLDELSTTYRRKIGLSLCRAAESPFPGECFHELIVQRARITTAIPKLTEAQAEGFCARIQESHAAIDCLQTSLDSKLFSLAEALDICPETLTSTNATTVCLHEMKKLSRAQTSSLTSVEIGRFCMTAMPEVYSGRALIDNSNTKSDDIQFESSLISCFLQTAKVSPSKTSSSEYFNLRQRLELCSNAPPVMNGMGPSLCANFMLHNARGERFTPQELIDICKGSFGESAAKCYLEGKQIDKPIRVELCRGAASQGPVSCYRRASSTLKKNTEEILALCVGADSEAPGDCYNKAPLSLSSSDRILLCARAHNSFGDQPVKCLQAIESATKLFANSPRIGLGDFFADRASPSERLSRELAINMCSFSGSQSPLASAECLRSAPKSLNHDDAVRLCTNVSVASMIAHMSMCLQILPHEWTSSESTTLCELAESKKDSEAIAKCAVDLNSYLRSSQILPMNRTEIAGICKYETEKGLVLKCVKAATNVVRSTFTSDIISMENIMSACTQPAETSGNCLAKLATIGNSLVYSKDLPGTLCKLSDSLIKLKCLESKGRREISMADLDNCQEETRKISQIKVTNLFSVLNEPFVTAGRRFSLWMKVFDQWGGLFIQDENNKNTASDALYVSINENNAQGAVLWGSKRNITNSDGILQFNNLIISQPGPLEVKIYYIPKDNQSKKISIGLFSVQVNEDPELAKSGHCLFIFQEAKCSVHSSEAQQNRVFPKVRNLYPQHLFDQVLSCTNIMKTWGIDYWINLDGTSMAEYRIGVDALWTGVGLPDEETPHDVRLGISEYPDYIMYKALKALNDESSNKKIKKLSKSLQKEIRRAYYRKSLQWHPDRWASTPRYIPVVQGIFGLIHNSYEALIDELNT